jgi:CheY-like chemotaxis protein
MSKALALFQEDIKAKGMGQGWQIKKHAQVFLSGQNTVIGSGFTANEESLFILRVENEYGTIYYNPANDDLVNDISSGGRVLIGNNVSIEGEVVIDIQGNGCLIVADNAVLKGAQLKGTITVADGEKVEIDASGNIVRTLREFDEDEVTLSQKVTQKILRSYQQTTPVVIVDDKQEQRELVKKQLSEQGWANFMEFADGTSCIDAAKNGQIPKNALFVMDWMLTSHADKLTGGINGDEVAKLLKENGFPVGENLLLRSETLSQGDAQKQKEAITVLQGLLKNKDAVYYIDVENENVRQKNGDKLELIETMEAIIRNEIGKHITGK